MSEDLLGNEDVRTMLDDIDPEKNYLPELVGEDKKYKTPEDLARSKMHADRHIKRLEDEAERMRKELQSRLRLEEIADRIAASKSNNQSPTPEQTPPAQGQEVLPRQQPEALTPEALQTILDAKLAERENFNRTVIALKQKFGDDYQRVVDTETKRLGLDKDFVNTLARRNPDALLRLVGGQQTTPPEGSPIPRSSQQPGFKPSMNAERTQKYYADLKKQDPVRYWSRAVQLQEHSDAVRLGEAFFDLP